MKKAASPSILCALMLLAVAVIAEAQQTGKVARIGFLEASTASGSAVLIDAFRQELSKLGWIEGKNLTIEYRFAEQKRERLRELAEELVRLKIDVIVTGGTGPTNAAKQVAGTIPIVMAQDGDPVRNKFIASLARPGGNITGLSALAPELNTKRIEVLKDAVPGLTRVGILLSPTDSTYQDLQLKELRSVAVALKLKLEEIKTQSYQPKDLESVFQTAKQKHVSALLPRGGRPIFAERKRIVELAVKYRLPVIYQQREFVDEGGLMSYGADYEDLFRRSAVYVDKILKGAKPADLPVQQPTKFEFVINLKAAKQIGLTVPVRVLERANQVIK